MTCIHCGKEHDPAARVCPVTNKSLGPQAQGGAKTMFGVGPSFIPAPKLPAPPVTPGVKPVPAAGPPASASKLAPAPDPGKAPSAAEKTNQDRDLALGKTMLGAMPPMLQKPVIPAADVPGDAPKDPAKPWIHPETKPSASPTGSIRLPTEEEARENPDLVISLDLLPPPPAAPSASSAKKAPSWQPADMPLELNRDNVPTAGPTPTSGHERQLTPVDLPKVGAQKPLPLPEPGEAGHEAPFGERLVTAAKSVYDLLNWALSLYLRYPARLFLLAAMVVLPASFLNSCVRVGVATFAAPSLRSSVAKVDFSARKMDLANRIARAQAAGSHDKQAIAELAALTAAEAGASLAEAGLPTSAPGWFANVFITFIASLLIAGLAYPMASAAMAVAAADRQAGARMPTAGEMFAMLSRRLSIFATCLIPAAVLVSLGYLLFVVPGVILSIALLFVAHVALFERKSGRDALWRSVALVKEDLLRVILLQVAFALAAFLLAAFIGLFSGATDSRALSFVRSIIGDVLVVAIFPIPSLAIARIYLDLRKRDGISPGAIARSAR